MGAMVTMLALVLHEVRVPDEGLVARGASKLGRRFAVVAQEMIFEAGRVRQAQA